MSEGFAGNRDNRIVLAHGPVRERRDGKTTEPARKMSGRLEGHMG